MEDYSYMECEKCGKPIDENSYYCIKCEKKNRIKKYCIVVFLIFLIMGIPFLSLFSNLF